MASPVHVAFLWHMHQPWYALPGSRTNLLPWTRLRATKDYTDMAAWLEAWETPATVNFTPCLTEQLRRYAAGELTDGYLPSRSSPTDLAGLISGAVPVARRGFPGPSVAELRRKATTPDGERALWGWFLLSWLGQSVLDRDPSVRGLAELGQFTAADLAALEDVHRQAVAAVLPRYRRLAETGRVELTATPFYHPILPLLLDSAVAHRSQPGDAIPLFSAPEDAQEQVVRTLAHHEETFGSRPAGMWPAEGAVSREALDLFAHWGVEWVATDEGILARTLSRLPAPKEIYRPWRLPSRDGEIAVLFRDTFLSNRISFDYHAWGPADAAHDLLHRLQEIGRSWTEKAPPLVLIAMDGENAWDFYAENGKPFFAALYRGLGSTPGLVPTTVSTYLARFGPGEALTDLWPGSWIDADFRTWIGHPGPNKAWEALAAVRLAVADAPPGPARERAQQHLLVAEGSDWFWWYGPHHSSPHEPVFDRLFRSYLAAAYGELGRPAPSDLTG